MLYLPVLTLASHGRPFVFSLSLSNFGPGQPRRGQARLALWPRLPRFFYPLVNPEILTAARILVGISEFIQASTNSSICDPGRKVLILPVIPGGRASLIPPGIKGGIPPGFPGRIGRISPGINGGIPPGTFHNPGRDPSWDPARKRRGPTWDEHGIPGGIGGIPHLILTWVNS